MNENGGRSTNILLTVIGIATLLVVVTGATFAYFAAIVEGNDTPTSVYIKAADDGKAVVQIGGQEVTLTGIYPREEAWGHQAFGFIVDADSSTADQTITFKMVVGENTVNFDAEGNAKDDQYLTYTFKQRDEALTDGSTDADKTTMASYTQTFAAASTKQPVPKAGTEADIARGTRPHNEAGNIVYDLYVYYDLDSTKNQNDGQEHSVKLKLTGSLGD